MFIKTITILFAVILASSSVHAAVELTIMKDVFNQLSSANPTHYGVSYSIK
jgi:hypothetical protein